MTEYQVVTSAGAVVYTFDDRKRALAFARSSLPQFGSLDVVMVERIVKKVRIKRLRSASPDLSITSMQGA